MLPIIFFIFCLASINLFCEEINYKIKLYALYTPSHRKLVDQYFLPSIKDDFELIIKQAPNLCPENDPNCSTTYKDPAYLKALHLKTDLIIDAIKENQGKVFVFSDVDIIFYRPCATILKKLIQDNDFVMQNDYFGHMCTGFFIMRGNLKMLNLWQDIKQYMLSHETMHEERTLNLFIKQERLKNIKYCYLPDQFYNGCGLLKKIPVPKDIILHHAGCAAGIENKIMQYKRVMDLINKK